MTTLIIEGARSLDDARGSRERIQDAEVVILHHNGQARVVKDRHGRVGNLTPPQFRERKVGAEVIRVG